MSLSLTNYKLICQVAGKLAFILQLDSCKKNIFNGSGMLLSIINVKDMKDYVSVFINICP